MAMSKHTPGPWRAVVRSNQTGVRMVGVDIHPRGAWKPTRERGLTNEDVANARLIAAAPRLKDALAAMLDFWGGYECPEVDAAITVMQELGEDRWSMQAQIEAAKAEGGAS